MNPKQRRIPPVGEVRASQLLTTYGPGAMVDLPNHSVIIGGLDHWFGDKERIYEERLEAWLRRRLGVSELALYAPPLDTGEPGVARAGVATFQFPGWFLAQVEETYDAPDGRRYRTRPLLPYFQLRRGCYFSREQKHIKVVPVRFVQACPRGHIRDIDWYAFVRRDFNTPATGALWFDEGGASNDFAEMYVRCEQTGMRRPLSDAKAPGAKPFGRCRGRMPWLGPHVHEDCDEESRLLSRAASYAYYSQTMSVIAIPDANERLREAVDRVWDDFLQYAEDQGDVRKERKKEKVASALDGLTDEQVWAEVERRRKQVPEEERGIKEAEIDTLLQQQPTLGEDRPDGDFYARTHPIRALPPEAAGKVDRLVLVHRLREVIAQVGFTRFEASFPDVHGELDLKVGLAPLARELRWLPAHQNRGEGVFLSFRPEAIEAWLSRPGVKERADELIAGHTAWCSRRGQPQLFPGLPYVMLHSLSHLLITTLALDCGYAASAIRERVYAGENGYGILLYTGSAGSEGTLGGLVEQGRDLGRLLGRALEMGRLCSNDPVCAQHAPADAHAERFLHGAACHGCLLIGETSCEQRNELLDRALVVPTVASPDAAFFGDAL